MNYKKILVTGATGFLGGRIVEGLKAHPAQVVATGRNTARKGALEALDARFEAADLTDPLAVDRLVEGCDLIIHCAALSSPWGDYSEFYSANVVATQNLISAAQKFDIQRFIFISTPSIYFDFKDRRDIRESDPLPVPLVNHYASTKLLAEKMVFESGIPAIALRPRALIGRGDTVIMPRVLYAFEQNRLRIIGSGNNIVSITPVANVVHAVLLCMEADEVALGRAYNISGEDVRLWGMLSNVLHRLGLSPNFKKLPYAIGIRVAGAMELYSRYISKKEPVLTKYSLGILAKDLTLNTDLARQYLGYAPIQTVDAGMEEFAVWWEVGERG